MTITLPNNYAPTVGAKHDTGKRRFDLLPWREIGKVVDVLNFGAAKYADNNWQRVEQPRQRYFAAAIRHLSAWEEGERSDQESGLSHLAHAACCVLFLMWFEEDRK